MVGNAASPGSQTRTLGSAESISKPSRKAEGNLSLSEADTDPFRTTSRLCLWYKSLFWSLSIQIGSARESAHLPGSCHREILLFEPFSPIHATESLQSRSTAQSVRQPANIPHTGDPSLTQVLHRTRQRDGKELKFTQPSAPASLCGWTSAIPTTDCWRNACSVHPVFTPPDAAVELHRTTIGRACKVYVTEDEDIAIRLLEFVVSQEEFNDPQVSLFAHYFKARAHRKGRI